MGQPEAEGIADFILDSEGFSYPVSPWELAAALRHRVEYGARGERPHVREWNGLHIVTLDPRESTRRQGTTLAHESSHVLCDQHGVLSDDQHAWWVAAALLLPRAEMRAMLRGGLDVADIVAENPHVSHELVARRIVSMSESMILRVWDVEPTKKRYRVLSPGWRWRVRTTPLERLAMDEALAARAPSEPVGGVRAWAVEEEGHVRILCLSDGEVLMSSVA